MSEDNTSTSAYKNEEAVRLQFSELVLRSVSKRVYPESCVLSTNLRSILSSGAVLLMALLDERCDIDAHAAYGIVLGSDLPMVVPLSGT